MLTHLANVYLLHRCIELSTASSLLASFGAALWGVSPLHAESIGFYSVYGHVLVGTALLLILRDVLALNRAGCAPTRRNYVVWYVLALAAATSFGTGTAIAIVLPFVLQLLLPPGASAHRRPPLLSLVIVVPCLYLLTIVVWEALSGRHIHTVAVYSSFLTTVGSHLQFITSLIAVGLARLILGFCPPHHTPALLAAALLAILVAALARLCIRGTTPARKTAAAFVLLLLANYGIIALARGNVASHAMEMVVAWGRYHYVGQLILALLVCLAATNLSALVPWRAALPLLAGWYALAVTSYALWAAPIDHHEAARTATQAMLREIREQADRQPPGATVWISNRSFPALHLREFPGWAGAFVALVPDDSIDGRPVRFVVRDPEARRSLASGRRTATLVVGPDDAPSSLGGQDVALPERD